MTLIGPLATALYFGSPGPDFSGDGYCLVQNDYTAGGSACTPMTASLSWGHLDYQSNPCGGGPTFYEFTLPGSLI